VQLVVLALMVFFSTPVLLPLGLPLVKLLGGEGATHYPTLFYALPTVFLRANLVITALVASIATGAATWLFARAFGLTDPRKAWARAFGQAPALIGVTALVIAFLIGIGALSSLVPRQLSLESFGVRWGIRLGIMLLLVVVQTFLAYTTAWIVLMGHGFWPAIRDSVRVALRTFLPTVIAVGIPALLLFPFSYASNQADYVATKLRPEMVAGLIAIEMAAQMILTFWSVGSVTRLFLWRVEAAR
jgi:hypothetical protein